MLYIGDSQDSRIREVDVTDNLVKRWVQLPFAPQSVELGVHGEFLMAASRSDGEYGMVRLVTPSMGFSYSAFEFPSPAYDIQVAGDSSSYFVTCPDWGEISGTSVVADSLGDIISYIGTFQGHPFRLSSDPIGRYLYILINNGGGTGTLVVRDMFFGSSMTEIPLEGYPWDLVSHRNGELVLVLIGE
jgi:hypothetical protein